MVKSLCRPQHAHHVGVDHAGGLGGRIERVGGIIFAAEQALFLGGDGEEDDRALRPRTGGEGARLLDQMSEAGAVVDRAIVDAVAIGVGLADAEMVPVRGVDHRLVRARRAGQDADDIVRGDDLGLGVAVNGEVGLERRPA